MPRKARLKTPQQDTGWGLIFRLNDLWKEVEGHAPKGENDLWNYKLDRIWCNLLYREEMEIVKSEKKEILNMKLSKKDTEQKTFLDLKIIDAKQELKNCNDAKGKVIPKKYYKAKLALYNALMLKDIWLRKFMSELGLYLKEIEFDPSKAIYGGQ